MNCPSQTLGLRCARAEAGFCEPSSAGSSSRRFRRRSQRILLLTARAWSRGFQPAAAKASRKPTRNAREIIVAKRMHPGSPPQGYIKRMQRKFKRGRKKINKRRKSEEGGEAVGGGVEYKYGRTITNLACIVAHHTITAIANGAAVKCLAALSTFLLCLLVALVGMVPQSSCRKKEGHVVDYACQHVCM